MLKSNLVEIIFSDLRSLSSFIDFVLDLSIPSKVDRSVFFCFFGLNLVVLGLSSELVDEILESIDGLLVFFSLINHFFESAVKLSLGLDNFGVFLKTFENFNF